MKGSVSLCHGPCAGVWGQLVRSQFYPSTIGHIGLRDWVQVLKLGNKAPLPAEPFHHLEKAFLFISVTNRNWQPKASYIHVSCWLTEIKALQAPMQQCIRHSFCWWPLMCLSLGNLVLISWYSIELYNGVYVLDKGLCRLFTKLYDGVWVACTAHRHYLDIFICNIVYS